MRSLELRGRGHAAPPEPPRMKRDPAPSRLAYRLERLWLRPVVRRSLRLGLPLLALATAGVWFVSDTERVTAITERAAEIRRTIEEQPQFMVKLMAIDGASPELTGAIRESIPIDFPRSSFDLDLPAMRAEIETLDAVAEARLRIRPGGILQVDITEREPALIWRSNAGLILVDASGHPIAATVSRADWPELPLITGAGAHAAAAEALTLFAAAEPLEDRLRGLQRLGERRWDLVLTDDQRILLPAAGAEPALARLLALDAARDLLARDITHVDLRLPDRPTLRLSDGAMSELSRIRALETDGVPDE